MIKKINNIIKNKLNNYFTDDQKITFTKMIICFTGALLFTCIFYLLLKHDNDYPIDIREKADICAMITWGMFSISCIFMEYLMCNFEVKNIRVKPQRFKIDINNYTDVVEIIKNIPYLMVMITLKNMNMMNIQLIIV